MRSAGCTAHGICGSGLIDAVAELLRSGRRHVVRLPATRPRRFPDGSPLAARLEPIDGQQAFTLVAAEIDEGGAGPGRDHGSRHPRGAARQGLHRRRRDAALPARRASTRRRSTRCSSPAPSGTTSGSRARCGSACSRRSTPSASASSATPRASGRGSRCRPRGAASARASSPRAPNTSIWPATPGYQAAFMARRWRSPSPAPTQQARQTRMINLLDLIRDRTRRRRRRDGHRTAARRPRDRRVRRSLDRSQHPDRLLAIHEAYIAAGSQAIITNSFGANRWVLGRYGLDGRRGGDQPRGGARWRAGGRPARPSACSATSARAAGSSVRSATSTRTSCSPSSPGRRARCSTGGADGIIIETMSAIDELAIAIRAARAAGAPFVVASMAFDRVPNGNLRTMMGVSPEKAAAAAVEAGRRRRRRQLRHAHDDGRLRAGRRGVPAGRPTGP